MALRAGRGAMGDGQWARGDGRGAIGDRSVGNRKSETSRRGLMRTNFSMLVAAMLATAIGGTMKNDRRFPMSDLRFSPPAIVALSTAWRCACTTWIAWLRSTPRRSGGSSRRWTPAGFVRSFGEVGGFTLKLVPILPMPAVFRTFRCFARLHGRDVKAVGLGPGGEHGRRPEGETAKIMRHRSRLPFRVRDPDGNTIELYQIIK